MPRRPILSLTKTASALWAPATGDMRSTGSRATPRASSAWCRTMACSTPSGLWHDGRAVVQRVGVQGHSMDQPRDVPQVVAASGGDKLQDADPEIGRAHV